MTCATLGEACSASGSQFPHFERISTLKWPRLDGLIFGIVYHQACHLLSKMTIPLCLERPSCPEAHHDNREVYLAHRKAESAFMRLC